jgi:uncharacterized protein (TIGR02145 family)
MLFFPKKPDYNSPDEVNVIKTFLITALLFSGFLSCTDNYLKDVDGNVYHTVKIGTQIWLAENYRVTRFTDGTPIPHVSDSVAWQNLSTPGYCTYENTAVPDTIKKYGALYNWYCVNSNRFAPLGWHVPTDDDWEILLNNLINKGYNWDGVKRGNHVAKALAAQSGWKPFGITGMPGNEILDNNRSGFNGFATGFRYDSRDSIGWYPHYLAFRHKAAWWSATEITESIASVYVIGFCVDYLIKYHQWLKTCGYSVRLVKDAR